MSSSPKSTPELEQIALAMMMMAGGEGTSASSEVVGVKTRSSSTRSTLQTRRRNNNPRQEPVSGGCLNKNKTKPASAIAPPEDDVEDGGDYVAGLVGSDPSHMEDSATDLVLPKENVPDETIVCAINPMSIQPPSSPGPDSPTDSQESTNSGSGTGSAAGVGTSGVDNDCVYMSSSRRMFRPEFKKRVLDAFTSDPECVGNQRATARKFGIHRRQVQKWLQQHSTGELVFKDLGQHSTQEDNEESYSDLTGLASNTKLAHSSRSSTAANRTGKVLTRQSVGNADKGILINQQQVTRNQRLNGGVSDPPTRSSRATSKNKGKSMPKKGGSKSSSHFVPPVRPSATSTSKSVLNLSKGGSYQNGISSNYAYQNDTNGIGDSDMLANMTALLASAAAAGNLGMPQLPPQENPRNFAPRDHSPMNNNGRGSPAHSAGDSSVSGGSLNLGLHNALILVDELNYLYPDKDFSLLRNALLKEEISLEKLAIPLIRTRPEFRVNGNGINRDVRQGLHSTIPLPPPTRASTSQRDYKTKQSLELIRQHQQYQEFLQQCQTGHSSDYPGGLNLTDMVNTGQIPLVVAAAAGMTFPSTSAGTNGKFGVNGHAKDNGNGTRKATTSDNHRFASPRNPPTVNSSKGKTVAAALAATRILPSQSQQIIGGNRNFSHGRQNRNTKAAQKRKPVSRQASRSVPQMDDDIDPTSMLEVVTSIPTPSISPRNTTSQYGFNHPYGVNQHHVQTSNMNADYNHGGMDLTTTSASSSHNTTTTTTTPRLISKAMNKDYSILNGLGLTRKSPEIEAPKVNGLTHTASLENFVQNIMPSRQQSLQAASSSGSSSSSPAAELNDSENTKHMVISAFNNSDISGDARAVARKFGISVRVVLKWLKEGSIKTSPKSTDEYQENGVGPSTYDNNNFQSGLNGGGVGDDEENQIGYHQAQNLQKVSLNESNNNSSGSGVNRRKNSKPNQICDFPMEIDDEAGPSGALDMVVPIKKRRGPIPASQDA